MRLRSPLPALLFALLFATHAEAFEIGSAAADPMATRQPTLQSRAVKTGRAFVSDLGYIVSSPFRLKGHGLLWTAGMVAATAVIYGYDGEIFEAIHRSRGNEIYDAALEIGNRTEKIGYMGKTGRFWVAGAVLGTAFGYDPLQSISLDVIESHLITGGIRNSFKTLVGRQRPYQAGRASFFKKGTSTPSGHTSVVFEVATILAHHTKGQPQAVRIPVGVVAYGVATCIAIQRVDSDGHWPSDVFLGAASGALIANTVARRNHERREGERVAGQRPMTVAPWMDESGVPRGILVSARF
jgi:membrane-associated phospholipid phosphatase